MRSCRNLLSRPPIVGSGIEPGGENAEGTATRPLYKVGPPSYKSKKSPTGPTERTPKPEYLIALATSLGVRW